MIGRSHTRARGRGQHASALWTPASIPNLTAWYKASTGVTLGGTPLATGTTPPVVTIAATDGAQPTASALRIEITTGGARGTALFKWSVNDGTTYEATGVATAATVVLASANITVTFPVGTYATDNVYRATVSQWNDRTGNALHLTQATAANQPVRVAKNSANCPTHQYDGSDDKLSAATKTPFRCMHDGTGCYVSVCVKVTNSSALCVILDSNDISASNIGMLIYLDTVNGALHVTIANATGTYVINAASANGTAPINTTHVFSYSYSETDSPKFRMRIDGAEVLTSASVGTPSAADSTRFLSTMLRTFSGGSGAAGELNYVLVYSAVPSAADALRIDRLAREYGATVA